MYQRALEKLVSKQRAAEFVPDTIPTDVGLSDIPTDVGLSDIPTDVGLKYDQGKPPLAIVPSPLIDSIAHAMGYGADKYGMHNYKLGMSNIRLLSACKRHINAYINGEDNDSESGIHHLGHAGACLAMLMELDRLGKLEEERYGK